MPDRRLQQILTSRLLDGWEIIGYDSDGDGTPDVDLPGKGTAPLYKDILVEVDWMLKDLNGDGDAIYQMDGAPYRLQLVTVTQTQ